MGFDVCMITTGSRPELLEQSLRTLKDNASDWPSHALTLVMDGCSAVDICQKAGVVPSRIIVNPERQGASHSRNIGAASTPLYARKNSVCFFDDDVYCCKGWDDALATTYNTRIRSGHAHPYNHPTVKGTTSDETSVLSTVQMAIHWDWWDQVGYFARPGGPGGSEDVDWCKRATALGAVFYVTVPQCIIHTGLGSTSGKPLVGVEIVKAHNKQLEQLYGIEGQVVYQ